MAAPPSGAIAEELTGRTRGSPSAEYVTEAVRQILEASGWMDRAAVEVRAEERGIGWRSARAEIDRLIRLGRIRVRAPLRDVERIAWVPADREGGP